jgi:hypothetical protein
MVVGDVLVGPCNLAYARGVIRRLAAIGSRARSFPLAFVLAQVFAEDAFKLLKERGVLPWTHRQFMNRGTADAIEAVMKAVQSFSSAAQMDPEAFEQALEGARYYGEIFGHIKGCMFELLVAHLLRRKGAERVDLSWIVDGDTEQYDVDVLALRGTAADIVECKGQRADKVVPFDEYARHVEQRVPLARGKLLEASLPQKPTRFRALVVASCGVETEPPLGRTEPRSRADTTIEVWDRARLLEELKAEGLPRLVWLVERFYSAEGPGAEVREADSSPAGARSGRLGRPLL